MEKYNKFIISLIVVIVLAMSIGYAALNSELSISGEVNYRPQEDVRVTSFTTTSDKPSEMTIEYSDYSKHQVKLGYTTTGACSITYTVKVENYSGVSMGLVSVGGQDSSVEIQKDIIGEMIVDPTEEKTFTIKFTSTQEEIKTCLLTFEFAQIYTVTYNDLGNTDDYVKSVFEGRKLEQNLGTDAEVCSVTMGGSSTSNYTFTKGTIIIPSVTGNVVINGYLPITENSTTPNPPELDGNMIPVYYDDVAKEWKKADSNNEDNNWYDYSKQQWANVVTLADEIKRDYYEHDADVGEVISMDDINTMWVWIPRYSYTIKSEDGDNYYGKKTSCTTPSKELPGEIDVKFISRDTDIETGTAKYTGDTPTNWRTNEAFDFPKTYENGNSYPRNRGGIWISKFETTGNLKKDGQACVDETCDIRNVTVKPGLPSLRNQTVSSFFFMSRSMQQNIDNPYGFYEGDGLHMMKNDEWGAVAYLSQSRYGKYGNSNYTGENKEIYINNDSSFITGNSGGSPNANDSAKSYTYDDMTELGNGQGQAGPGASTTGNITGIYDMSGGANEYVMGVLEYDAQGVDTNNGKIATRLSGFEGLDFDGNETGSYELPNEKYYNKYKSFNPTSNNFSNIKPELACNGVCYGHALSEIVTSGGTNSWYNDSANFVNRSVSWFTRSGGYSGNSVAGIFNTSFGNGSSYSNATCRLAIVTDLPE